MTPKLEIHPADGDFIAATYTLDKTASVTGRGFSACDAVANLRVFLQPFGYELPNVEVSEGVVALGAISPDGRGVFRTRPQFRICDCGDCEYCHRLDRADVAASSPISECDSAVDRVFKQHLSTGRN